MWLGIAFVGLAVFATILQAWLWSFPMVPDPGGPDPNGRSTAPRFWTLMHRVAGGLYVLIYVVLMWEMVPRLWEYQVELPSRTVMHAVMGILIGVLLAAKISVIRWFQHFGKSLPALGLGLLACTLVLGTLSIPFAVRAHDFGALMSTDNLDRVRRVLHELPWGAKPNIEELVQRDAMATGQRVLAGKCTDCHDIRTILQKPRSGESWYDVVVRMAKKPTLGDPITDAEVAAVTSYLVAINRDIQASSRMKRAQETAQAESSAGVEKAAAAAPSAVPVDLAKGKELIQKKCTDCHDMSEVEKHGGDTAEGWAKVIQRMVTDQGLELTDAESKLIIDTLAATYPKKDTTAAKSAAPAADGAAPVAETGAPAAEAAAPAAEAAAPPAEAAAPPAEGAAPPAEAPAPPAEGAAPAAEGAAPAPQ